MEQQSKLDFDPLKMKMFEMYAPTSNTVFTRIPGGFAYGDMQGTFFISFDDVANDPQILINRSTDAK